MLPPLLAVGAIAAVVLLLVGIFGQTPQSGTSLTAGATTGTTTPSTTPPTAPATTPPATSPAVTTPATTQPVVVEIPSTTVVVLNSTDTSGLAGRVTDYLGELGWQVGAPDNFLTRLEVTTVYYPEGMEAEARLLAAAVPGTADTVVPAIPEVDAEVLTVVLGSDAVEWVAPGEEPPATTTTTPSG